MARGLNLKLTANADQFNSTLATARNTALKHAADMAGALTKAGATINTGFKTATVSVDLLAQATARTKAAAEGLQSLGGVGNLAAGLGGAVAGFLALKFAVDQTTAAAQAAQERLAELVKLGVQARDAGVGTTFLQSLTGQAKTLGTEVSSLTSMLDKAREASTTRIGEGDGKASSSILDRLRQNVMAKNLDANALDRFTGADSQEARIKVILDLLDQLKAKGATVAALDLARTMFGADFETKLRTGVDMIGAMRRALDGIGVGDQGRIIPPEEIQRAEALNSRLEEAKRTLEAGLLPIQRDIAFWQQQQLSGWVDIKEQIAGAAAVAGRLYEFVSGIGKALGALGSANVFKSLRDSMDSMGLIDKGEVDRLNRNLNGGLAVDEKGVPKDADAGGPLRIAVKPKADTSRSLPSLSIPKSKTTGAPTQSEISAIETFVGSLEKSAAALRAETDAYGKSAVERRIAIELAKAHEIATQNGTKLTEEQTKRIREASTALAEQREKLDDLREKQEAIRSGAGDVFHGMYSDARNGATALDMLNNALGRVLDRIANSSIDTFLDSLLGKSGGNSTGVLGGLLGGTGGIADSVKGLNLGSLFGASPLPTFAAGVTSAGIIEGPGTGTSDSILARVSRGESIVTAKATAAHRGLIEAMNAGTLPAYATGRMPELPDLGAGSAPRLSPAAADRAASGGSTEIVIMGGTENRQTQSAGPMGVRHTVMIDKAVAAALANGADTRSTLKRIGGSKLTGR